MLENLIVRTEHGHIRADIHNVDNYRGIDIEYVDDHDRGDKLSRPRILVTQDSESGNSGEVEISVWMDKMSDSCIDPDDISPVFSVCEKIAEPENFTSDERWDYDNPMCVCLNGVTLMAYQNQSNAYPGVLLKCIDPNEKDPHIYAGGIIFEYSSEREYPIAYLWGDTPMVSVIQTLNFV